MKVEVTDGDVIAGVRPRAAYAPSSLEECAEVMAMAARDRLRVGFVGAGTALALGAPPRGLDLVIRTGRLARILEYAPADLVIVVEAGVTLAAIQAAARAHGQRLAIDPPHPDRATIGGAIATGAFGPLRARHGAIRDLIIGVTLVRADGEIARGGGKVVKNVAGFDLPRLACGALGTLGLVAGAAFRLHPLPEAATTIWIADLSAAQVLALLAAARHAQLEPARAIALSTGDAGRFELAVELEGFARGVDDQATRLLELAARAGHAAAALGADDAIALVRRHDAVRAAPLRVRGATLPTRWPAVAPALAAIGAIAWYPTLGVGFAGGDATATQAAPEAATDAATNSATDAAITRARAALTADGGTLVVEAAPHELAVDPWGAPPQSFPVMAQLKQRFDPDGRLNPGRFVGGL